jgi:hypothetical protein
MGTAAGEVDVSPGVPVAPSQPDLTGWRVHTSAIPVAIECASPRWPDSDRHLLHDLAGAFAFGFDQVTEVWVAAHANTGVAGYVVRLTTRDAAADDVPPISVAEVDAHSGPRGTIAQAVFLVDAGAVAAAADADIMVMRHVMAAAVGDAAQRAGVPTAAVSALVDAWDSAPPTLAVEVLRAPTVRTELALPWELDEALVSGATRELARRVHEQGVAPGVYVGDDAKALDRDVLAPIALDILTERLAAHRVDALVMVGMEQLERILAAKQREARDLEQSARTMRIAWDPADRLQGLEESYLALRRCAELVVEATLRDEPTGDRSVDRLAWMELIAAAYGYLVASSRSEAVHHQVTPTAIEITGSYEIRTVRPPEGTSAASAAGSGRVYDLDLEQYRLARAAHTLGAGRPMAVDDDPDDDPTALAAARSADSGVPDAVDAAMRGAYGAAAIDLLTSLFALALWPLPESGDDVAVATTEELVDHVLEGTVLADEADGAERARAAIGMLTSTPDSLRGADWRPWHARTRRRRLLIQPLAQLRPEFVVVAPHLCFGSASVYWNYLTQGLLPWSAPAPPEPLARALEDVRDRRNRQLEEDVADTLRDGGYVVQARIRRDRPQRLGVPSLSGEIDTVAGRAGTRVLWLLEVKDPTDTFVVPEIRRHLDRFYVGYPGKPAYVDQLAAKVADLSPHADSVAASLGLPPAPADAPYEVRPVFVTRRPVAAAYVSGPHPFVTLSQLLSYLRAAE